MARRKRACKTCTHFTPGEYMAANALTRGTCHRLLFTVVEDWTCTRYSPDARRVLLATAQEEDTHARERTGEMC